MNTLIPFPEYNSLNTIEQLFYTLIQDLKQDTLWRDAIRQFLKRPHLAGFRQLVKDLKSQAYDNSVIMQDILGCEAYNVLESL